VSATDWISQFITSLSVIYILFIFLHVILGVLQTSYSPWLGRVRALTYDTVEPYLAVFRRILPPMGGMDFSPLIAAFSVGIIAEIANVIVRSFG
jgi:YggT family protein